MSPLSAAVARVQLKHLAERNAQRNANCIYLSQKLEPLGVETLLAPPMDPGVKPRDDSGV
jgi:dTDP-4-amino-4,6-dideoxygalactose transaminase